MNKELREYIEEMSKAKAAKVEPQQVGQVGGPEEESPAKAASGSFSAVTSLHAPPPPASL